jgi:uncharacterized protein YgiM (DUF1202 family)
MLVPAIAWGQADESPVVIGRIIEDNAPVHAGAGDSYYVVGHLAADTIVTIEDRYFEWYKIVPPQGVFSFIEKARVDVDADGSTGRVNQDRTPVRAAGLEGQYYRRQLDLHKGDAVRIVSERGEFYRIAPPDNAYVYVRTSAVKREQFEPAQAQPVQTPPAVVEAPATPAATATPAASVAASAAASTASGEFLPPRPADESVAMLTPVTPAAAAQPQPTTEAQPAVEAAAAQPTVAQTAPPQPEPVAEPQPAMAAEQPEAQTETSPQPEPAVPVQPEPRPAESAVVAADPQPEPAAAQSKPFNELSFEQLERVMAATDGQPLEQQPIDELLGAYERMYQDPQLNAQQRRQVLLQIIKLRRNASLAVTLREISQVRQSINAAPSRMESYSASIANAPAIEYDAVGQLMASSVYDGINLPRLYRVVSSSMRTIVYVRPSDAIDVSSMLGQVVGVAGPSRYDSALKMRVLEAREIDLLRAQPSAGAAATE